MTRLAHAAFGLMLLAAALPLATSCAEVQEEEARVAVSDYLNYAVRQEFLRQAGMYDVQSATALLQTGRPPLNPYTPRQLRAFEVQQVTVEGSNAQAQVILTFEMLFPGSTFTQRQNYKAVVYLIHEPDAWKVNELRTRVGILNTIIPGSGDTWLANLRYTPPPQ